MGPPSFDRRTHRSFARLCWSPKCHRHFPQRTSAANILTFNAENALHFNRRERIRQPSPVINVPPTARAYLGAMVKRFAKDDLADAGDGVQAAVRMHIQTAPRPG